MKIKRYVYLFTPFFACGNLFAVVNISPIPSGSNTSAINGDLLNGMNTLDTVSFESNFAATAGSSNVTNSNTAPFSQTISLTNISATVPGESVVGFTFGISDLFDDPSISTFQLNATTGLGDVLEFVITEESFFDGVFPQNGLITMGNANFTYSSRLNGGAIMTSSDTIFVGSTPSNFFEVTTSGDSISSVDVTYIGNSDLSILTPNSGIPVSDRTSFEGIAFSTASIPEPTTALLGVLSLPFLSRRKR